MVTFPSTSDEHRAGGRNQARPALLLAVLALAVTAPLRAGTLITLTGGSEIDGKLSLSGGSIHAEAESSPPDTALTDVLESRFDDAPFSLHFFDASTINQLPAGWVAQDIGEVTVHGSFTVQSGTFTLTGSSLGPEAGAKKIHDRNENFYFVGVPWSDNGQFTARLVSLDPQLNEMTGGVVFRDSLDPAAPMSSALVTGFGEVLLSARHEHGRVGGGPGRSSGNIPLWLRMSRYGDIVYTSVSSDGITWNILNDVPFKDLSSSPLFGMYAHSTPKQPGKAVLDNVSITPLPSSAKELPAGVVLQGGSLLVGHMAHLDLSPSAANDNGELVRGEDRETISRSQIAAVAMLPFERSQLAQLGSNPGLLMRNGDTTDGDITNIGEEGVSVSSVLLGITNYKSIEVRCAFIQPLQLKPAAFEVRLRDGSILNASAVSADASEVVVSDISGATIQVNAIDVAQIRAGTALVQNLAELDWKATAPGSAPTAAPAPTPAPAPAGMNNAVPPANPPAPVPPPPLVNSWLGNDQEQILEAATDTSIEFPLPGKFRALGVQIALTSDSPANATATIHILADGHEVASSPPFHAGDPPRFLELSLPTASRVTLLATSIFPGTKVLYVDPVAIRQ
jgi:hypothetical protein